LQFRRYHLHVPVLATDRERLRADRLGKGLPGVVVGHRTQDGPPAAVVPALDLEADREAVALTASVAAAVACSRLVQPLLGGPPSLAGKLCVRPSTTPAFDQPG
jgi:hypothetical protein